jgi:hypothetical protein
MNDPRTNCYEFDSFSIDAARRLLLRERDCRTLSMTNRTTT